jgi:hypothetical protein
MCSIVVSSGWRACDKVYELIESTRAFVSSAGKMASLNDQRTRGALLHALRHT